MAEKVRVGIQGSEGSSNHRACLEFSSKGHYENFKMVPLGSSRAVLDALQKREIDFGIFAWKSSRKGIVEESRAATEEFPFELCAKLSLQIDHALLCVPQEKIEREEDVHVYSHPQAILEHEASLREMFPHIKFLPDKDTAFCAEKLKRGDYLQNSLVIAPIGCAKVYGLQVYEEDLPANEGYVTEFFLVKSPGVK